MRKRKKTILQQAHEDWLRSRGLHKSQIRAKKKKQVIKSVEIKKIPDADKDSLVGSTAKKEPNKYSGSRKLIGIATMHKSNMVPVFEEKDAEDIARMRR